MNGANPSNGSASPDILYILSPSYSGSTLLTFLLATHPDIATIGELKASALGDISVYHCSCGALLTECGFWKQVKTGIQALGGDLDFNDFGTHFRRAPAYFRRLINLAVRSPAVAVPSNALLKLAFGSRLNRILVQNDRLIQVISRVQNGRVFLDGSKDPERLKQFLDRMGDRVKVLHLIRDGRGVTNSFMRHYQTTMPIAVKEIVKTNLACNRVMEMVPKSNGLRLRYEDFCKAPEASLASIFRLAGLNPTPARRRSEPAEFHILGNAMRLEFGKPIKLDEKWRASLTPEDLRIFYSVAGDMNKDYGYSE